jgi:hypothetical protein
LFDAKDSFDEVRFLFTAYGMGDPKVMTTGARKLRTSVRRQMKRMIKDFQPEFREKLKRRYP